MEAIRSELAKEKEERRQELERRRQEEAIRKEKAERERLLREGEFLHFKWLSVPSHRFSHR